MLIEELVPIHTEVIDAYTLEMYLKNAPGDANEAQVLKEEIADVADLGLKPGVVSMGGIEDSFGSHITIAQAGDVYQADSVLRNKFHHSALNIADVRGIIHFPRDERQTEGQIIFTLGKPWQPGALPDEQLLDDVRNIGGVRSVALGQESGSCFLYGPPIKLPALHVATDISYHAEMAQLPKQLAVTATEIADSARLFLPRSTNGMPVSVRGPRAAKPRTIQVST